MTEVVTELPFPASTNMVLIFPYCQRMVYVLLLSDYCYTAIYGRFSTCTPLIHCGSSYDRLSLEEIAPTYTALNRHDSSQSIFQIAWA